MYIILIIIILKKKYNFIQKKAENVKIWGAIEKTTWIVPRPKMNWSQNPPQEESEKIILDNNIT